MNEGIGTFNSKYFNKKAFGAYYDTIPQERLNLLIKSGVLQPNRRIKQTLSSQTGSEYAIIPMFGRLKGKPVNYDGVTKYDEGKTPITYKQGVVAIGRKDKFYEDDFTFDVTSGVDFMSQVALQTSDYWDTAWEDVLMTIISGIFGITTEAGLNFAEKHTYDITKTNETAIDETTQNKALQQACGDRRRKFAVSIVNSMIATNLENKKLVSNLKYNDANGIERDLNMYTWNGKILIEYDDITTETTEEGETNYITYVLGKGAFDYEDLGAKNPHEMDRDAENDRDYLYQRQRKAIAPHGISYLLKNQVSDSPTDAELADGANWDLVQGSDGSYYDHREIAIARIISKG